MKLSAACITLLQVGAVAGEGGILRKLWGNKQEQQQQQAGDNDQASASDINKAAPVARRRLNNAGVDFSKSEPSQEFYVPLPENDVFYDMFRKINPNKDNKNQYYVRGDMISLISVAVSTDNTMLWYDHWEDAYEVDITKPTSRNTEIWGDGDASNGCRPGISNCRDEDDYLNAGDSFVIENSMRVPRASNNWHQNPNGGFKYDGGDRLLASFPITMTRGEYAQYPGSLLAGGVEVLDTGKWGKKFVAPIGYDTSTATEAFEYTRLFIMSATNNNRVKLPDGTEAILQQGGSLSIDVKQGDKIEATDPVQVDLCAGDINSTYELRWFSLLALEDWSNDYMTPVGDSFGRTKMVLYNPNPSQITVRFTWLKEDGIAASENIPIGPNQIMFTRVIPTGSGAQVSSDQGVFIALSMTDTENRAGTNSDETLNEWLGGQAFDWGFPVMPTQKLTPQVLVGWGYGCTANDCKGKTERSTVWISPVADADIYVDYQNTGGGYTKYSMKKLQSRMIRDTNDHDMSGAIIFATVPGSGHTGTPVDIAAAWGQDPSVSRQSQEISLDLGTVVLPFTTVRVRKDVDKFTASPGDVLTYTITVQNVGQTVIKAGDYTIVDPLNGSMLQGTYVEGSTQYSANGGKEYFVISDDLRAGKTPFPLDEDGLKSQRDLPRRGGEHKITFKVIVDPEKVVSSDMVNTGYIKVPYSPNLPFTASTKLGYSANIIVDNVVYRGDENESGCNRAEDSVTDIMGSDATFCFTVTNTGPTHLKDIHVTNDVLGILPGDIVIPLLAPGQKHLVTKKGKITGTKQNVVKAVGTPAFKNGDKIGIPEVAATDPSRVLVTEYSPKIEIQNTVFLGHKETKNCRVMGIEKEVGPNGQPVTFCFTVTNTGNTPLTNIKVDDPVLDFHKHDIENLAPGESVTLSTQKTITESKENMATAIGTPCIGTPCTAIPGAIDVTNTDPSEVGLQIDGDTRSADKTLPETCMQTNWEDAGNSQNLVCRAKEVYLEKESITSERMKCTEGEMITVSIDADIHFNAARYDVGWYVAKDGGDALVGKCEINGLKQGHNYNVRAGKDSNDVVGSVAWNNDAKGSNDKCGDVFTDGGGGCNIMVPFLVDAEIKCGDDNGNEMLDFSVCFSWRTHGTDGYCTMSRYDPDTEGELADMYPGTPSKCFCARYDVPTITVEKKTSSDYVSPC